MPWYLNVLQELGCSEQLAAARAAERLGALCMETQETRAESPWWDSAKGIG